MDKPICPVCGRLMQEPRPGGTRWFCFHGKSDCDMGWYYGPSNDPDGTKVRAQIAAMEKRIHDSHPHTHGGYADKGVVCPQCAELQRIISENSAANERTLALKNKRIHGLEYELGMTPKRERVSDQPAKPATCGECAWGTDQGECFSMIACDNAACKREDVYRHSPACPAFVAKERGEG